MFLRVSPDVSVRSEPEEEKFTVLSFGLFTLVRYEPTETCKQKVTSSAGSDGVQDDATSEAQTGICSRFLHRPPAL